MEKERADNSELKMKKLKQNYSNSLDYQNRQHDIDLETNETIYE
ncbi:hypothetical protein CAEBREN_10436 [Caenorhabditis brenneri]|uniref:Uncharacterized protein n=1 Tax=Caenorhabditis brenneri TaxID=135651 RepID=G0P4Z9_CAEBE|nr:hypothetical protein CAEBREN_10436 [Caenorhabditis brenneri]